MHAAPYSHTIWLVSASLLRILIEIERVDPKQKSRCGELRKRLDGLVWKEVNGADSIQLYQECMTLAHTIFSLARIFPDNLKIAGMESSYIVRMVEEVTGDLLRTGDLPQVRTSDIPPILDDDDNPS